MSEEGGQAGGQAGGVDSLAVSTSDREASDEEYSEYSYSAGSDAAEKSPPGTPQPGTPQPPALPPPALPPLAQIQASVEQLKARRDELRAKLAATASIVSQPTSDASPASSASPPGLRPCTIRRDEEGSIGVTV